MKGARLLLIDDEEIALDNLKHLLSKEGYEIRTASGGPEGVARLQEEEYDLIITDLRMPGLDGFEVLQTVSEKSPDSEVIVITGFATIDSAVEAMKKGAYHYITKPYRIEEVRKVVREAVEKRKLRVENRELRGRLNRLQKTELLTSSREMEDLLATARKVAGSDCNVLITGESGTGKELLARYIHENSPRRDGPLVAVNCGVFTEELLASELFGHEKGSFTGADRKKIGILESAEGGTVLLDEITEMNPAMQVKLLRVLQEREVMPVGANRPRKIHVRFLAATNRVPRERVEAGAFRQDLYFRLNVVNLHLPPLAERGGDIELLIRNFLERFNSVYEKNVRDISDDARKLLENYDFPGNIRELENIMERAVVLAREEILGISDLPDLQLTTFRDSRGKLMSLEDYEQKYIEWVLRKCEGKKARAAEILGIDRVSLWRKIKKYESAGKSIL